MKEIKNRKTSNTLGILSIIMAIVFPIVGLTLGIIGLSIKKEDATYNQSIALNIIGIILSIVIWIISPWIYTLLGL